MLFRDSCRRVTRDNLAPRAIWELVLVCATACVCEAPLGRTVAEAEEMANAQSERIAASGYIGDQFDRASEGIPLRRVGQPHDIGQAVLSLASESAAWITGERLQAAGRQHY
jgi:NAD(P)-dependent dehydrogenase (short-subunit alcohol dehydrogenase family)